MSKRILIATTVLLCAAFMPLIYSAPDSSTVKPPATTTTDMTKDAWLSSMTPLLPELICKGFVQDVALKKRFDELKLTYEQCVTMIPESSTKCQNQIYASIPAMINQENASVWGRTLGECIGKDFAEKHLTAK